LTPPHFWALALMIKNAYAAAGVPMLPVVRGDRETARQILLYSLAMVGFTVAVGYWLGPLYTVAAAGLGAAFIVLAVLLRRDLSRTRAQLLFHYSLLALLFTAGPRPSAPLRTGARAQAAAAAGRCSLFWLIFAGTILVAVPPATG
jgi:heme O synthase-like polyprenyltransferase